MSSDSDIYGLPPVCLKHPRCTGGAGHEGHCHHTSDDGDIEIFPSVPPPARSTWWDTGTADHSHDLDNQVDMEKPETD